MMSHNLRKKLQSTNNEQYGMWAGSSWKSGTQNCIQAKIIFTHKTGKIKKGHPDYICTETLILR